MVTSITRPWRVDGLAAWPNSLDELQHILVDEVYPVSRATLFSIAGEWRKPKEDIRHVGSRRGSPARAPRFP